MTTVTHEAPPQQADDEALRLQALADGRALIKAAQEGASFGGWEVGVFPDDRGVVFGYKEGMKGSETATSLILSLSGCELYAAPFVRAPHPLSVTDRVNFGDEYTRSIQATVTPAEYTSSETYDVLGSRSLLDVTQTNVTLASPYPPYTVHSLLADIHDLQSIQTNPQAPQQSSKN